MTPTVQSQKPCTPDSTLKIVKKTSRVQSTVLSPCQILFNLSYHLAEVLSSFVSNTLQTASSRPIHVSVWSQLEGHVFHQVDMKLRYTASISTYLHRYSIPYVIESQSFQRMENICQKLLTRKENDFGTRKTNTISGFYLAFCAQ